MSVGDKKLCEVCEGAAWVAVQDMAQGEDGGDWKMAAEHHYCQEHFRPGLWAFNDGRKLRGGIEVKE